LYPARFRGIIHFYILRGFAMGSDRLPSRSSRFSAAMMTRLVLLARSLKLIKEHAGLVLREVAKFGRLDLPFERAIAVKRQ